MPYLVQNEKKKMAPWTLLAMCSLGDRSLKWKRAQKWLESVQLVGVCGPSTNDLIGLTASRLGIAVSRV